MLDNPYIRCPSSGQCGDDCKVCKYNAAVVEELAFATEAGGEYYQDYRSGRIDKVRYDRLVAVLDGRVSKNIDKLRGELVN